MLVVGLTGGIGSGKSEAADRFAELGVPIIDTDRIARELTQLGEPALTAIGQRFGSAFFQADGNLDRTRMRNLVFNDAQAKRDLEAILHPLIKTEVRKRLRELTAPYVIVAVPLLFESGEYGDMVNRTLAMDSTEEQQIERVMRRSKISAAEVRSIMANQIGRGERLRLADDICTNQGNLANLCDQVISLHEKYLKLAS